MGLEERWVKQDPKNIVIYATNNEWRAVSEYLKQNPPNIKEIDGNVKIGRSELISFIKQNPVLNLDYRDINHSFLIAPKEDGKYMVGALSRSKAYIDKDGNNREEGILGHGAFGRTNPCIVKDSDKLTESEEKLIAVKTLSETSINPAESDAAHEVSMYRSAGREIAHTIRERSPLENTEDVWIYESKMGNFKGYIFQPLARGEEMYVALYGKEAKEYTQTERIDIAFAASKAIKELHDKGIIHCDIKEENFSLMHDSSSLQKSCFLATLIDFGFALKMDEKGEFNCDKARGTMGFIAPEILDENGPKYSKASDIFALGVLCKYLLRKFNVSSNLATLIEDMMSTSPEDRPHIGDVVNILDAELTKAIEADKRPLPQIPTQNRNRPLPPIPAQDRSRPLPQVPVGPTRSNDTANTDETTSTASTTSVDSLKGVSNIQTELKDYLKHMIKQHKWNELSVNYLVKNIGELIQVTAKDNSEITPQKYLEIVKQSMKDVLDNPNKYIDAKAPFQKFEAIKNEVIVKIQDEDKKQRRLH